VKQLLDVYQQHRPGAVIAVQDVPPEETGRYGIAEVKPGSRPMELKSIIEKPRPGQTASTMAQFGRFVLSSRIIEILENLGVGKNNELWFTDAIDKLSRESRVLVQRIEGTWYTIGDPLRYLIANVEYGLHHPEIGRDFADYLQTRSNSI
jgi:UTP--glucose-1-phosphate uridylyltransferase